MEHSSNQKVNHALIQWSSLKFGSQERKKNDKENILLMFGYILKNEKRVQIINIQISKKFVYF